MDESPPSQISSSYPPPTNKTFIPSSPPQNALLKLDSAIFGSNDERPPPPETPDIIVMELNKSTRKSDGSGTLRRLKREEAKKLEKIPVFPQAEDLAGDFTQCCVETYKKLTTGSKFSSQEMEDTCRKLMKYNTQGYHTYVDEEGDSQSLSLLVDKILKTIVCNTLLLKKPLFAKEMGQFRFDCLAAKEILNDIVKIQEMLSRTFSHRLGLHGYLGKIYRRRCRNAKMQITSQDLAADVIPEDVVRKFYQILQVEKELDGISADGQRRHVRVQLLSPDRIPYESNNSLVDVATTMNDDQERLRVVQQSLKTILEEVGQNPNQCLDDALFNPIVSRTLLLLKQVGIPKEQLKKATKTLARRCIQELYLEGLEEKTKLELEQQLVSALPEERQANWVELGDTVIAVHECYRRFRKERSKKTKQMLILKSVGDEDDEALGSD